MNEQLLIPTKKQNSYTYWVDSKNKSKELPIEHQPKKLLNPVTQILNSQGPSVWNSLGSWEQKKISLVQVQSAICERVKEILSKFGFEGVEVSEVTMEGDAYKVYKKNKWNVIYQLKGSIKFKKEENKATIKLIEVSNLGDKEYQVEGSSEMKTIIQPHAETFIKAIEDSMNKYSN